MLAALSDSRKELLDKLLRGRLNLGIAQRGVVRGIVRRPEQSEAPLSYGQQQVWLHSQYSTEVQLYNEPVTVHRYGAFDRIAMEMAFTEIIRRHEAWRTTFGWKELTLTQRIQPPPHHIEIPFADVSALPVDSREERALRIAEADALAPFDLEVGPMYRPRLVRFSNEEHRLYLALHPIIFDGVSLYRVFLPELQTLYESFSQRQPSPLEPPRLQYGDYAVWHRQWVEEIRPVQLAYWRKKLQGVERRDILRPDRPGKKTQSFRGAMETLALDIKTTQELKEISHRAGATLFMTLLAAFHALLWVCSGEEDLFTGGTSAGRYRSETEKMLGFFLNTIVLRTDLSGDPTFLELIERGKEELITSLDHDGIPFETLVKELAPERDGGVNPFFQASFSFEPPLAPLQPNWRFTQMDIETGAAKFDLHLELDERQEGIIGRFIYSVERFDRATIQDLVRTWHTVVASVVADAAKRLSQLVPDFEKHRRARPDPDSQPAAREELSAEKQPAGWIKSIRWISRAGTSAGGAA
jgi:hypothetical protein